MTIRKESIGRIFGTFLFLTVIAAGVYAAGGYGVFTTTLFTQEATLQGVNLNSTTIELEFENGSPSPGEKVSFTYVGEIEHNIYPGAVGFIVIKAPEDSYFVSSPYPEAIKVFHMEGKILQNRERPYYMQEFRGDLLNRNEYTPIQDVIVPGGTSQILISGYCEYGLVEEDTQIDLEFEYVIHDACDIGETDEEPDEPKPVLPIEAYSILLDGEKTFSGGGSHLSICDINCIYVRSEEQFYDCKVVSLSPVEWGAHNPGNITSIEIIDVESELSFLLTYVNGEQRTMDIPATGFNITYESTGDSSIVWTDIVTINIALG